MRLILASALILIGLLSTTALTVLLGVLVAYQLYLFLYFRSQKFLEVKEALDGHVADCNALNEHIAELKTAYHDVGSQNYGTSEISDNSLFSFRRGEWSKTVHSRWTLNCSAAVAKNAHNQPFKYLCKYFNISADESSLEKIEHALNNFAAAQQGRELLVKEREELLNAVHDSVPFIVRLLSKSRLSRKLGFKEVDLTDPHYPVYTFQYVSSGGKSSFSSNIKLDIENLELFAKYLAELVKFRKSVAGQRALMTASLREKIKNRDGYACKSCGASVQVEPNLLLEIDHVVPLSKGGITAESNLQTLCWRCNRRKGTKLFNI
jgi:Restriction endonuclease